MPKRMLHCFKVMGAVSVLALCFSDTASSQTPEPSAEWKARCDAEKTQVTPLGVDIVCVDGITGQSVIYRTRWDAIGSRLKDDATTINVKRHFETKQDAWLVTFQVL